MASKFLRHGIQFFEKSPQTFTNLGKIFGNQGNFFRNGIRFFYLNPNFLTSSQQLLELFQKLLRDLSKNFTRPFKKVLETFKKRFRTDFHKNFSKNYTRVAEKVSRTHDQHDEVFKKYFNLGLNFFNKGLHFFHKNLFDTIWVPGQNFIDESHEVLKFLQKRATLDGSRGVLSGFVVCRGLIFCLFVLRLSFAAGRAGLRSGLWLRD